MVLSPDMARSRSLVLSWRSGSLTYLGTLGDIGSLAGCGTLNYYGSLESYGTLSACGLFVVLFRRVGRRNVVGVSQMGYRVWHWRGLAEHLTVPHVVHMG